MTGSGRDKLYTGSSGPLHRLKVKVEINCSGASGKQVVDALGFLRGFATIWASRTPSIDILLIFRRHARRDAGKLEVFVARGC